MRRFAYFTSNSIALARIALVLILTLFLVNARNLTLTGVAGMIKAGPEVS